MLDPFHQKYGNVITAILSMGSLCLDVLWVPTTLTGLGTVLSTLEQFMANVLWLPVAAGKQL